MASLQIRSDLRNTIQQHNNRAAGSLIARQLKAITASASILEDFPQFDTFMCDTTAGSITMTLPTGTDAVIGLPVWFYKTVAGNTLTVQRLAGSGNTIEGSTSVATTGVNTFIALFWDGSTWRRWNASVAAGTGLLAAYGPVRVATLVGTGQYWAYCPYAGTVTSIVSITEGILTTGDATLTAKIGATGITDGVITIANAASAAGDIDTATPSALNTVVVGSKLSLTVGGTNATATVANCLFEITRT